MLKFKEKLSVFDTITVDTDKFIVANNSGSITTAGNIDAAGNITAHGNLTIGDGEVDEFGDLVSPTQTRLNGDLFINGSMTISASTEKRHEKF